MKKITWLILPAISLIFAISVFLISSWGYQSRHTINLHRVQPQNATFSAGSEITPKGKININTASTETLSLLPGIGEKISVRIISYRETNGPFTSVDQLLNIKGIGKNTLQKIKHLISV